MVGPEIQAYQSKGGILPPSSVLLLATGLCSLPPVGVSELPNLELSKGQSLNSSSLPIGLCSVEDRLSLSWPDTLDVLPKSPS